MNKTILLSVIGILLAMSTSTFAAGGWETFQPHSLKAGENFVDPLGFYNPSPVLSWKLPVGAGIQSQSAYRILVSNHSATKENSNVVWDSGKVESDQSVWVPYQGPPLKSRQSIFWRVKFWDELGRESSWSEEATIEMGLLTNADWDARWIEAKRDDPVPDKITILKAEFGNRDGVAPKVADVSKKLTMAIANGATPMRIVTGRLGVDPAPGEAKKLWVEYEVNGVKHEEEIAEKDSFDPYPPITAQPGYIFRRDFNVAEKPVKARLYACALGIYEFQINGQRVGNDLLAPGYTTYAKRVETRTYDVTTMIRDGDNGIGALLGEGWYAGNLLLRKRTEVLALTPKLLGQLELTYADGRVEKITTDDNWRATDKGPIRAGGFYHGEDFDASLELGQWSAHGYDDDKWAASISSKISSEIQVVPKPMPPVRVMKELDAVAVTEPEPGKFVFDFGQNVVGFPHLKIPVRGGQKIKIRFAEMLEPDGTLYTTNYRTARSQASYIAATDGVVQWEPSLSFFGFRYVEISGLTADVRLKKDAVKAKVIHTDFRSTGKFTSSHEKLNQLQSNIRWGQIGNFVDIPTDCPQRDERLGWTGDAQVFLPTSFFNYDVHSFWARWLQSVRDEQTPDGKIPHTVPATPFGYASPGWADVIVTAPWEVYERTGDIRILTDNYEAMKRWVGVYERNSEHFIPNLKGFGDWLQPYSKSDRKGDTAQDLIATAYFGRDARILFWTATALGKPDEAMRFKKLHADIRSAFSKRYFADAEMPAGADTQTACLMGLGYDLIEPALRENVEARLLQKFESAHRHLQTGFLGTPLLAPVFDEIDNPEICYELLFKESYPSWFYSINQGATTMWERWNSYSHADGFGDASMNSFNHYAYGAIGQFMYERIAGLSPDPHHPGYKHFYIRPLIGDPLQWVSAELDTPYGIAKSSWAKSDKGLALTAVVPPNTTATVVFPTLSADDILVGDRLLPESKLAKSTSAINEQNVETKLGPGTYTFTLTTYLNN